MTDMTWDRDERSHAQTWDPVSGMAVKRAVSSVRRTQAIFSRELRAPISLLNMRMFFSSVLNLMTMTSRIEGCDRQRETAEGGRSWRYLTRLDA